MTLLLGSRGVSVFGCCMAVICYGCNGIIYCYDNTMSKRLFGKFVISSCNK